MRFENSQKICKNCNWKYKKEKRLSKNRTLVSQERFKELSEKLQKSGF